MNLNTEKRVLCVCVSVCVCVRQDSFWVFLLLLVWFGFGFGFQTFIYLTLIFYVCIYTQEYISHFSAPDNMPSILVTSSIPQAARARRGRERPGCVQARSNTNTPLHSRQTACLFLKCLVLCCFRSSPNLVS